jgi:predicted SAM-dependent methyltransferase
MGFGGRRHELKHHIRGDGIEIGALHHPFDISDLPVTRIRYVDRLPVEDLRSHYPELGQYPLVPIDIIDDGQVLGTVANESLDFIIANHMIEHCDNPLGAIENWMSKLRWGGIIFIALPDQRKGWDEARAITSLEHMVEDYRTTPVEREKRNYQHFKDWVMLVGHINDEAEVQHLITINYSIHFHVFTYESFRQLLAYASGKMLLPFQIIDSREPSEDFWESIFVLQKNRFSSNA